MTIGITKIQVTKANSINHTNTMTNTAFKGTTATVQNDTIELNENKKGMSKSTKWLLSIIGSIVTLGIAAKYGYKAYINRVFKNKCSFLQLPENIEFVKANSLEDAIKFSKEILKIKDVDKDFSLNVLNMINKELVRISNIQKGKVCMPQALKFKDLGEYTGGQIHSNIRFGTFGEIEINKNYFNEEFLNKQIDQRIKLQKKYFMPDDTTLSNQKLETFHQYTIHRPNINEKFKNLVEKYLKDKNSLSMEERVGLNLSLFNMQDKLTMISHSPESFFRINKDKLKEFGIDADLDKFINMSDSERFRYTMDIMKLLEKNNNYIPIDIEFVPAERIIRHEMGHLQDYAKNYKEFFKNGNELDRWNNDIERIKKKLNDEKTKKYIQEHYPLTCEFLDPKNLSIAGEVSEYAKTDIAEFIAETYADLLAGKKFSNEVMELYKKYNAPMVS